MDVLGSQGWVSCGRFLVDWPQPHRNAGTAAPPLNWGIDYTPNLIPTWTLQQKCADHSWACEHSAHCLWTRRGKSILGQINSAESARISRSPLPAEGYPLCPVPRDACLLTLLWRCGPQKGHVSSRVSSPINRAKRTMHMYRS
eukprot:674359-Pyramimonas_sp.AAC.2